MAANNDALPDIVPFFMCEERRLVATRLGVTEEQVKRAVRAVGPRLATVRAYLGK